MRKLAVVLLLLVWGQSYGQPQIDVPFSEKLFSSSFTDADKSIWPLKNNQFYTILIRDGAYRIESMADGKKSYLIPKGEPLVQDLKMEAMLIFDKNSAKGSSAGLALQVHNNLEHGYLIEMNANREYRVSKIEGAGKYKALTGNKEGWVSNKAIEKAGKENHLSVTYYQGALMVEINGEKVFNRQEEAIAPGQNGIFISGQVKLSAKEYALYGPGAVSNIADSTTKLTTTDSSKNATAGTHSGVNGTGTELPKDMNTLTSSILECRKENQTLKTKCDNTQIELTANKQKVEELQKFIQQNLDVKLQQEMERLKKENEQLKAENEKLKADNASMVTLQDQVKQNKDGDLIITLSDNLKKEQEKNNKLNERIKYLDWQLRLCKSKLKP